MTADTIALLPMPAFIIGSTSIYATIKVLWRSNLYQRNTNAVRDEINDYHTGPNASIFRSFESIWK